MATGSENTIIQLRAFLSERFPPKTPSAATPPARQQALPTGVSGFDALLESGGLPAGELTELVADPPAGQPAAPGPALVLHTLVGQLPARGQRAALIDGRDTFDPQALDNPALARLLWVRCRGAQEALQAADLLVRDGNLPLVVLDLAANALTELRRVASSHWWRLQRAAEESGVACLILSPVSLVASAATKLRLRPCPFPLEMLDRETAGLLDELKFSVLRQRSHAGWADRDGALRHLAG